MMLFNPDIVKFAVTASSQGELEILLEFALKFRNNTLPACVMSMGKYGPVSRIASPLAGAFLTYGFLGEGPSVPGQVSVTKLREKLKQYGEEGYHNRTLSELVERFCKE
jgi:3-dehydroquinate dehydratase type I